MKRYRVLMSPARSLLLLFPVGVAADAPPFVPTLAPAVRGEDPQNPHPATTDIPPLAADYTLAATVGDAGADGAIHVTGTERVRLTNTGKQPVPPSPSMSRRCIMAGSRSMAARLTAFRRRWIRPKCASHSRSGPRSRPAIRARSASPSISTFSDGGDGFDVTRRDGDILRLGYWFPMLSDDHGYHDQFDAVYTATGNFHVTLTAPAVATCSSARGVIQHQETAGDAHDLHDRRAECAGFRRAPFTVVSHGAAERRKTMCGRGRYRAESISPDGRWPRRDILATRSMRSNG